jgi:hypothetical protein
MRGKLTGDELVEAFCKSKVVFVVERALHGASDDRLVNEKVDLPKGIGVGSPS